jgi:hypothetical protein
VGSGLSVSPHIKGLKQPLISGGFGRLDSLGKTTSLPGFTVIR